MKKILALALALIMVLALAACGGNDTPDPSGSNDNTPSNSEQQPSNTPDESFEWPDKASAVKWTGTGKIVGITEMVASAQGEVQIYIDAATLEEVGAYVEMLKGRGITYYGEGDEPTLAFEGGEYSWAGNYGAIQIYLYEEPESAMAANGEYQLKINVYTKVSL